VRPTAAHLSLRNALSLRAVRIGLLACAYFAAARIGLSFADYHESATLVWGASGLSLAALILFGLRLWPGVFVGAAAVNFLITDIEGGAAVLVGVGNTLEAVIGAALLRRVGFRPTLERVQDVVALLGIGALGTTIVSASVGVAALWLSGSLGSAEPAIVWTIWWLGDAGGVIIVAPVLFMAANGTPPWRDLAGSFEFWSALALIVALTSWSMSGTVPEPWALVTMFTPFPLVVWAGTRLGSRGAVISSVAITAIATVATARGVAPACNVQRHEQHQPADEENCRRQDREAVVAAGCLSVLFLLRRHRGNPSDFRSALFHGGNFITRCDTQKLGMLLAESRAGS